MSYVHQTIVQLVVLMTQPWYVGLEIVILPLYLLYYSTDNRVLQHRVSSVSYTALYADAKLINAIK